MKSFLLKLASHSFVQGSVLFTATNFLGGFINYIFNILTARILGPIGYGELAAFSSYIVILSIPLSFMNSIIIQKVGKQTDQKTYVSGLYEWYFRIIKQRWYLILLAIALSPLLPSITNLQPATAYILIPFLLFNIISAFYDSVFQSMHLFTFFSIISIVTVLIKLTGAVVIGITIPSIEIIFIFLLLSGLIRIIANYLYFTSTIYQPKPELIVINKKINTLLKDRQIWLTILSAGAITLLGFIDVIVAKKVLSAQDAGLFSSWSLLAKILFYGVGPLISISFIFFASIKYKNLHGRIVAISLAIIALIGIIAFSGYSLFSELLVNTFVGSAYQSITPYIKWASLYGTLYIVIVFLNNYLLSRQSLWAGLLAISLPIYFILISIYGQSLEGIIWVNLGFGFTMVILHLGILAQLLHKSIVK